MAFAGVLAMEPEVLVLDEPVAGLDPLSREEFLGLIRELHAGGRTIVMVSHSMEDLAALSDRILVLSEGRVFRLGTPAEVFAVRELHAGGRTIVMVSHSMEDLAALSDRILVLSEGRVFRLGTPAEVFADAAALKAVGLGAPAPEAFAASLREAGFTLGRDLYDERTLAADIAAQLEGAPAAAMLGAAPAPEAFAASLREAGFTLGRDLYDERTLAADIAAQLEGAPAAAMLGAAPDFAARQAADAVAEGGDDDA